MRKEITKIQFQLRRNADSFYETLEDAKKLWKTLEKEEKEEIESILFEFWDRLLPSEMARELLKGSLSYLDFPKKEKCSMCGNEIDLPNSEICKQCYKKELTEDRRETERVIEWYRTFGKGTEDRKKISEKAIRELEDHIKGVDRTLKTL